MSHKRKPKSNNLLDIFFNNVLFVKRFQFRTSLDMDTANARLHGLSEEMQGWLYRTPRYTITTDYLVDHYQFDIRASDRHRQYTISHATGLIQELETDETLVEGEIRLGVVYFFWLFASVLWTFFLFQYFRINLPLWLIGFTLFVPVAMFGHMIHKRNRLLNKIQSALTPRMSDRRFHKSKSRRLSQSYSDIRLDQSTDASEQSHYGGQ